MPRRLVPDNLKTGVIKPDIYDPKLNHAYAELAEHYKCLIDPARAAKPKDKPRVERPMPYVRDSYFAGGSGSTSPTCKPGHCPGAPRWPVGDRIDHSTAPLRSRSSRRSRHRR